MSFYWLFIDLYKSNTEYQDFSCQYTAACLGLKIQTQSIPDFLVEKGN
jgi:hypothetical protein